MYFLDLSGLLVITYERCWVDGDGVKQNEEIEEESELFFLLREKYWVVWG